MNLTIKITATGYVHTVSGLFMSQEEIDAIKLKNGEDGDDVLVDLEQAIKENWNPEEVSLKDYLKKIEADDEAVTVEMETL